MPTSPHPRPAYLEATTTGRLFRRRSWTPEGDREVGEYDTLEPLRDETTFDPGVLDEPTAEAARAGPRWSVMALGAALIVAGLGGMGTLSVAAVAGVVLLLV